MPNNCNSIRRSIISLFFISITFLVTLFLFGELINFDMKSVLSKSRSLAIDSIHVILAPEPKEFLMYVLSCFFIIITPLIFLLFQLKIKEKFNTFFQNPYLFYISELFLILLVLVMLLSFFYTSYAGHYFSGLPRDPSYTELVFTPSFIKLSFLNVLILPFIILAFKSIENEDKYPAFKILEFSIYVIIFFIFLVTEYNNIDKFHLSFVIDSIVFLKKGLLISDMYVPQYGLYGLFLLPLFSIIELSVLNLSIVLSALNVLVIFLIYQSLKKIFDNNNYYVFFIIFSITFISIISNRFFNSDDWDHYFQFSPLRTLFPALCIYLFTKYNKFSALSYTASIFLLSFGLFWNFETGFIVILTYLISEIYRSILIGDYKEIYLKFILGTLSLSLALFVAVVIFSPYFVDSMLVFLHPIYIYAGLGLVMFPMRVFGEQLILLIPYCISIFSSLIILSYKERSQRFSYYFFFSILGLGVFIYYLGRSVSFNLYSIFYPFIILCGLFFYDFVKNKSLKKYLVANLTFMIATFFIFVPIAISSFSPQSYLYTKHILRGYNFIVDYDRTKLNLPYYNFINQNTKKNEPVLVFMRENTHEIYINTHISIPEKFVYEYHVHLKSQEIDYKKSFRDGLNKKIITTESLLETIPYKDKYEIQKKYEQLLILNYKE